MPIRLGGFTRALALGAALGSGAGCGAGGPLPRTPGGAQTVPIVYSDAQVSPGKKLPLPLLSVEVRGRRTFAVVDTGARAVVLSHAMAEGFADAPHGPDAPIGVDPTGKSAAPQRVMGVHMNIVGLGETPILETVRTQLPSVLERMGVGVILPPQALVSQERAVLVDFRAGKFGWVSPSARPGRGLSVRMDSCIYEEAGTPARALIVQTEVAGVGARMSVNTGAHGVGVSRRSPAGTNLVATHAPPTAADVGEFKGVPMTVDSSMFAADISLLDLPASTGEGPCARAGRVGMRFFKSCTMVITSAEVLAQCDPP